MCTHRAHVHAYARVITGANAHKIICMHIQSGAAGMERRENATVVKWVLSRRLWANGARPVSGVHWEGKCAAYGCDLRLTPYRRLLLRLLWPPLLPSFKLLR